MIIFNRTVPVFNVSRNALRKSVRTVFSVSFFLAAYFSLTLSSFKDGFFSPDPLEILFSGGLNSFSLFLFLILSAVFSSAGLVFLALTSRFGTVTHPIDRKRQISSSDYYGNTDFEKPWQYRYLAQIRPASLCRGHIYGMLDGCGKECIDYFPDPSDERAHVNSHIFAIGASGSGKTFSVGKTYCLQSIKLGHSVIHTDPKGELFSDMANVYRRHGYIVRRLNFNNPVKSDGWDCMKSLREETDPVQIELRTQLFASAVVSQICPDTTSIYHNGPVMLLKALILRLILDDSIPGTDKNIKTIYSWLTDPGGMKFLEALFSESSMDMKIRPCLAPWGSFRGASGNLSGNLIVNLASGITVLSSGIISDILSRDDIDLLLPCTEKCAYFIQFPVPNDAFRFPVALFFTMFFDSVQNFATLQPGHSLPRQIDCMLDEFAQCGIFPSWANRMSVFRSYGINVFMIVQTITQFTSLYKDDQDTIISNCATWLMLGTNDHPSAEMFCKRIGQTTIDVRSESVSRRSFSLNRSRGSSGRVSVGAGRTSLLSSDEIMKLPANSILILLQRHNPIWANAFPHTLHPYAKEMSPADDENEPFFYDSDNIAAGFPVRAFRLLKEKADIDSRLIRDPDYIPPDNISDAPFRHENGGIGAEIIDIILEDVFCFLNFFRKTARAILFSRPSADQPEGELRGRDGDTSPLPRSCENSGKDSGSIYP